MPSIHDVAFKAGVSVATVSRVLNHSAAVLPETQRQVWKAVEELGYKPLRTKKNPQNPPNIMVLIPDITNNYYSAIVKGIGDYCVETDRNMILCNTYYSRRRELEFLDIIKSKAAQGAIFLGPELSCEEITQLNEQYSVVQCCEYLEDAPVTHISIDNRLATREAMRHLLGLGHTKIALITSRNNFLSTRLREFVYYQMMEEAGIPVRQEYVKRVNGYDFKNGLRGMMQLMQLSDPPTAVFALSDTLAIGAVSEALSLGCRVPEDVAVMGFDGIDFASMYTPALTTVSQPSYDLGYNAMDMLMHRIKRPADPPEAVYLEHELKIKASTVKL